MAQLDLGPYPHGRRRPWKGSFKRTPPSLPQIDVQGWSPPAPHRRHGDGRVLVQRVLIERPQPNHVFRPAEAIERVTMPELVRRMIGRADFAEAALQVTVSRELLKSAASVAPGGSRCRRRGQLPSAPLERKTKVTASPTAPTLPRPFRA